ncbi:MAG: tripartite tricarboxylate transporter permease [Deltaproteobacteria bacterium]|nr:tripartite tricarboxylate transporter permease [Deltaproteobacteria bacterium]MBW2309291.1 tripartite tricarboxylate transporter permease [Deltaproteobacteria bacterium]
MFLYVLLGVVAGIVVGVIPGLTATMALALLVPFTFGLAPTKAMAMLMGIYCGGVYGGSTSSILLRIPGTPSAAATLMDGYPMAQQGRAGKAIITACVSSFAGGLLGALLMTFLAPQVARFALRFGPAEYFTLALLALTVVFLLSGRSILKGIIAMLVGLFISTVGLDPISGLPRFTYGTTNLLGGISFLPAIIGLFGFSQVFTEISKIDVKPFQKKKITSIFLSREDFAKIKSVLLRSTIMGVLMGILPGIGGTAACWLGYGEAKRKSKNPEKFGTGIIEGVAAPEAANNASIGGAMIPMLSLGIPGDTATAILLGALTIHGLEPGPLLFRDHINVTYSVFMSMILANILMVVVGVAGAKVFAEVVNINKRVLLPLICVCGVIGSYAMRYNLFDVYLSLGFGVLGYFMYLYEYPIPPLVLAMIMGPMAEQNLRRTLNISDGSFMVFFTRPISLTLILLIIIGCYTSITKLREIQRRSPES